MGIFGGGNDAPDLRPFLAMVKQSVTQAEGKMADYDKVIDNFTNMGIERYNASQSLFGPWQERMNNIFMQTNASSYATQKNQTFGSQLANFNKRAMDKFFKAGMPMGSVVGAQRGVSQDIMKAQYAAQTDYSAKHEVAKIHEQAMQTGDAAMKSAFNQLSMGMNFQQNVSQMYAQNAVNQQAQVMQTANVYSNKNMFDQMQTQQRHDDILGGLGTAAGGLISGAMNEGWFSGSNANAGQGPTMQNANALSSFDQFSQNSFGQGNYNPNMSASSNMGGVGSAGYGFNF